jgi:phospholipase C
MSNSNYQYLVCRDAKSDKFKLWEFDPDNPRLVTSVKVSASASLHHMNHLIQVGNYVLEWSSLNDDEQYTYRLMEFDPSQAEPFGSVVKGEWTKKAVQAGSWSKRKFFGSRSDFANSSGAKKGYESGKDVVLHSMHNFVLNWIPTDGRGTYQLFNFDHGSSDPLPAAVTPQGAWLTIQTGHELVTVGGYVIDWEASSGNYSIWQFDAQNKNPLSYPAIQSGNWKELGIDKKHTLVAIGGEYVLDWVPGDGTYRLWEFDHSFEYALKGPIRSGKLPKSFSKHSTVTPLETLIPVDEKKAKKPGTMDFMRSKIEHVVYYMIENRSLDHVCGWLYENDVPNLLIGSDKPYNGVDKKFKNEYQGKEYAITKYQKGKLPTKKHPFDLDLDQQDPYHDNSDVMRQLFRHNLEDYASKGTPDMGGFAWNNGTAEVMTGYTPDQLPVLNGLASAFAISDEWFCSMPGGTDVNRAFSLTGSSFCQQNNFQNGVEYTEWSDFPHRPSIWKVLWSNGETDWKIYNAVEWFDCKFTYNLFLKGQIPTIDGPFQVGNFAPQIIQFYDDARYDTLPKFSFLEPKWVASRGSTSYHPGNDLVPGERALKDIFDALQDSPAWEKTLFVITFDEHGGIADHVPPPYAAKPYANDTVEGFDFDILGVRVPTILVSPWITEKTVFRSETNAAYDSTSILATVLEWLGIPKSKWGLGERTHNAPTFEGVLTAKKARKEKVELKTPWDSSNPLEGPVNPDLEVNGLQELMTFRMVADISKGQLSSAKAKKLAEEILATSPTQQALHQQLGALHKKYKGS